MGFLKLIGAVSAAEHEAALEKRDDEAFTAWNKAVTERDDMRIERDGADARLKEMTDKFKKAVKDIAGLTDDVQAAEKVADARAKVIAEQRAEIAALRPDAEKHRAKLDRDRNRVRPSRAKAPTKAVAAKGKK